MILPRHPAQPPQVINTCNMQNISIELSLMFTENITNIPRYLHCAECNAYSPLRTSSYSLHIEFIYI